MKKIMSGLTALVMASCAGVYAENQEIISIDSIAIMQKSIEGKELGEKIKAEIDQFQAEVKKSQKELADMQDSLNKQAKILNKEALAEKTEEIASKRKDLEHEFSRKEETLRASIQKKQIALRESQLVVINELFEKDGGVALMDRNTPGLLCVKDSIDKTERYLDAVDTKYKESKATKTAKASTPATVKSAAKEAAKPSAKAA
jgi:Skp family chaperone for outer membrane proteins